jgi:hypothetical protein
MDLEKLKKLKERLSKVEENNQQNIGAKKTLLDSLKKDFKITSLEEAKKEYKKRKKEFDELENEIEERTNELMEELKEEGII